MKRRGFSASQMEGAARGLRGGNPIDSGQTSSPSDRRGGGRPIYALLGEEGPEAISAGDRVVPKGSRRIW